jgi:hypothetical protein
MQDTHRVVGKVWQAVSHLFEQLDFVVEALCAIIICAAWYLESLVTFSSQRPVALANLPRPRR